MLFLLLFVGSAAAEKLLFIRDDNLWLSDTQGEQQQELDFFGGKTIESAALSPNGQWAVVACGRDSLTGLSHILTLRLQDFVVVPLALGKLRAACDPSFSPSGDAVVLVAASDCRTSSDTWSVTTSTMSVTVISLGSGGQKTILSQAGVVLDAGYLYSNPSFSPDGTHIAYQESGSDVSGGFVVVDLQGQEKFRYPLGGSDYPPYWKPQFMSATRLLCWSPDASGGGSNYIYEVDMASGAGRNLTKGANPTLVEGGKAIVFERWSEAGDDKSTIDLWRQDLSAGKEPVKIIENGRSPAGKGM